VEEGGVEGVDGVSERKVEVERIIYAFTHSTTHSTIHNTTHSTHWAHTEHTLSTH
jgi:hypothetical protein